MRKIVKISILILFILFVLGITTSKASPITDEVVDNTKRSYCMEQSIPDMDDWEYLEELTEYSYPDYDEVNGHAKAYIYAARNDIKNKNENADNITFEDIQDGVYHLINQGGVNYISYLAKCFQQFKNSEKPLKIEEGDSAKTIVNKTSSVYGPIRIEYNYLYAESGDYYDEWGGFVYAFVDANGNNISDKVKLCTLENGTYKEIHSTKIEKNNEVNGYYMVNTGIYKDKDLYAMTEDRTIGRVYLKVRSYSIEYIADIKIGPRKSETAMAQRGHLYCSVCQNDSDLITLNGNRWVLWYKAYTYTRNVIVEDRNSIKY